MCSQFNSSSSFLMVLPKCNFLSSRPFLDFQDECQNSPPQHTQEDNHELVAQNQEDHIQQDTQQQQHNNKKEEEELFEDNAKEHDDDNNKTKPRVIPRVRSEEAGRGHTTFTSTFKKDNTKMIPTSPERVSNTRQMMICPPAPKKKKTFQVTKRKLYHYQEERVFLDVYDEVESMFPPALLADLDNKIKKARKTTSIL